MDPAGPTDPATALHKLFDHVMAPDVILAGDRIDAVLALLDTWDELRIDDDWRDRAATWARDRAGHGFATVGERGLGDVAEVPAIGQADAVPPDLLDVLAWELLVEPDPPRFEAQYRAALVVAHDSRDWCTDVDTLAGHLLLVHDVDARGSRRPGDDPFDLLDRLWTVHLPLADLDTCLGEAVARELAID